ncbi:MAG: cupin domain-containing protein [Prevotella sp.]|nr:cupin domain-containing protein [Prevotella sp.]
MKKIETIKTGKNYAAVTVGRMDEIIEHELPMGPGVTIQGKVFAGQAVGTTGSELSFQTLVPGQDSGFLHTHKTHEELYIILKGEGQYQVDGEIFPVSEGTIVRVSPDGKRALKNTGDKNLTMLCIQYKANVFGEADSPMTDGNILKEPLKW